MTSITDAINNVQAASQPNAGAATGGINSDMSNSDAAAPPVPTPAPTGNSGASVGVVSAANGYGVNLGDIAAPAGSTTGGATSQISYASTPSMGVINNVTPGSYNPSTYTAGQANTTDVNVTPDQLVENRVAGIIDKDSPLMQRARAQGLMQAGERGLINSSLGVQAAQTSVLDSATPIAAADASTYAAAARQNASEQNTSARFNTGQTNDASQYNSTATNQAGQFNADQGLKAQLANQDAQTKQVLTQYDTAFKTSLANADAGNKVLLTNLDNQAKIAMTNLEGKWKTQIQGTASASDAYRQMIQNITNVVTDANMDGAAKQAAIDQQSAMFDNYMKLQNQVSGLNLSGLLTFSNGGASTAPAAAPAPADTGAGYTNAYGY